MNLSKQILEMIEDNAVHGSTVNFEADGKRMQGKVVARDEDELVHILSGNRVYKINKSKIIKDDEKETAIPKDDSDEGMRDEQNLNFPADSTVRTLGQGPLDLSFPNA